MVHIYLAGSGLEAVVWTHFGEFFCRFFCRFGIFFLTKPRFA